MVEKNTPPNASNGQKGKGNSPFDLIYQHTHQNMKEGKTYQYEVILVNEDKYGEKYNRKKMGVRSTLSEARTLACKSASQPKTEAMLFRLVVYTDKAGKREIKSYSHIETWKDHNGKPVRVIDE